MNFHQSFSQHLASLSYAGRCPTWNEYEQGAPVEQRAILDRWLEIQRAGFSDDWAAAVGRYGLAMAKRKTSSDEAEFSAQERFERGMTPGPDAPDDAGL
jgi:hypothetical protein